MGFCLTGEAPVFFPVKGWLHFGGKALKLPELGGLLIISGVPPLFFSLKLLSSVAISAT
jgi:hypothetical protein